MLADLDRRDADTTAAALYQQPLARLEIPVGCQTEPGSEKHRRQRSGLGVTNAIGHWPDFRCFCDGVLRVATRAGVSDDALPHIELGDTGTDLRDNAREFPAGNDRQLVRRDAIGTLAQAYVGTIQ